jgi:hypothetical protein
MWMISSMGLLAMGVREEAVGEAINLGSASETKVVEMALMVNRLTGNEAGITYTAAAGLGCEETVAVFD